MNQSWALMNSGMDWHTSSIFREYIPFGDIYRYTFRGCCGVTLLKYYWGYILPKA